MYEMKIDWIWVTVVTVMLTAIPVWLISVLMIWISKGELLPKTLLEVISNPCKKVRALIFPLKLVLNGRRTWMSFPATQPASDPESTW